MNVVIGTVKTLNGKFFAKDSHGDVVELHVGDKITKDMVVFGDQSNNAKANIKIGMLNLEEAITLTGLEKQTFDMSLIEDNNIDDLLSLDSLKIVLHEDVDNEESDNTDDEDILDDTEAGEEQVVKGQSVNDIFATRNDEEVDVSSSLRNAKFNSSKAVEPVQADNLFLRGIDIKNADDTAPVIADQAFNYAENQVADAVVANVAATDNVAVTTYTFDATGTQTSADGFYTITNTGEIQITAAGVAAEVNDYETGTNTATYDVTAADAEGNETTATITLNETDLYENLTPTDDSADVYEAGLNTGTDASSNTEFVTGNLLDNDNEVGANAVITEISSNGNTDSTVDVNGILTINTQHGDIQVYTQDYNGHHAGDYEYELTNVTSGDNVIDSIIYTIDDGVGVETQATLNVNIVDDAPIGTNIHSDLEDTTGTSQITNLVIILDRSGSMDWGLNGQGSSGPTRMEIAREALSDMFKSFDNLGNVNIKFVDFASDVNESGWFNDDLVSANTYLNGLNPNGGTSYDIALDATMNGYTPPVADRTLAYFISDGEPNSGHEIDTTQQVDWENFLTTNNVDISFGIGITNNVNMSSLEPIAYPDTNTGGATEPYAIQVLTAFDLKQTLLDSVSEGVVQGDASVLMLSGSDGITIGADGGSITSIEYNGVEYNASSGNTASIVTLHGGILDINFDTGEYFYTINSNEDITAEDDVFQITATDGDGDTKTVDLVITLNSIASLDANRDYIVTNVSQNEDLVIDADSLTQNDSGTNVIDSVSNAVGGALSGTTDNIIFSDSNGFGSNYTVINDNIADSDTNPLNNSFSTAVDLTDRGIFGAVTGAEASAVKDASLASVKFIGEIKEETGDSVQDKDMIKVTLRAGETIILDIDNGAGGVELDSWINLYDASHTLVAQNDDSSDTLGGTGTDNLRTGDEMDSYLEYTATQDGVYYIEATTWSQYNNGTDDTGDYELWISIDSPLDRSFEYIVSNNIESDSAIVDIDYQSGDTVTGSDKDEILIGRDGMVDTLNAGGGNDQIDFENIDTIDAGTGYDILMVNSADGDINFDSATIANIQNIEAISLEDGTHNITISLDDVLDMTEASTNTLDITALTNDGDSVTITDTQNNWSVATEIDNNNGTHSFEYTNSNSGDSITLTVDDQIDTTGM